MKLALLIFLSIIPVEAHELTLCQPETKSTIAPEEAVQRLIEMEKNLFRLNGISCLATRWRETGAYIETYKSLIAMSDLSDEKLRIQAERIEEFFSELNEHNYTTFVETIDYLIRDLASSGNQYTCMQLHAYFLQVFASYIDPREDVPDVIKTKLESKLKSLREAFHYEQAVDSTIHEHALLKLFASKEFLDSSHESALTCATRIFELTSAHHLSAKQHALIIKSYVSKIEKSIYALTENNQSRDDNISALTSFFALYHHLSTLVSSEQIRPLNQALARVQEQLTNLSNNLFTPSEEIC